MIPLPPHAGGLLLGHNEHRNLYQSLAHFIEVNELTEDFESPEQMRLAIAVDECWTLQWYPDSPVGFYRVAAPTLNDLLRLANAARKT